MSAVPISRTSVSRLDAAEREIRRASQQRATVKMQTAPASPVSVVGCLRTHAQKCPNDIAFSCLTNGESEQTTITYAELDHKARAIAACLQDMGLSGERVVLAFPAGLEFIAAYFGVLYAGCVSVPTCEPRHRTLDGFLAISADAGASIALSTADAIVKFKAMNGVEEAISWLATDGIADANAGRWIEHDPTSGDHAMIQYTSGSTSRPKGVMLSHGNLVANSRAISHAFSICNDSKGVFWLPTYHDMGLIGGVLVPVFSGRPSIVMAPAMFLHNPFLWLDAISKSRATISGGPNFAYDLCVRKITAEQRKTLDLSSWAVAFIGAEAVQPDTLARFAEAFAPCGFNPRAFYPCYGLAEATLMVTGPKSGAGGAVHAFSSEALTRNRVEPLIDAPLSAPRAHRLVGCGTPVGTLRIAVVDAATNLPVAPDRIGEIWVAGDCIGVGYWRDPQRTAAKFQARLGNNGGGPFLRTGDVGFTHAGQLYITGRVDDLIIVRGVNHHPQDIEATARASHPLLESGLGAAFAFDDAGVQRLALVQEVERDGSDDLDLVIGAVRASVIEVHGLKLDAVVLIRCGTIPKTSSGKVRRHASRDAFLTDQLRPVAQHRVQVGSVDGPHREPLPVLPQASALVVVCQHALAISGISLADITPESPISALGLDSLQRVELVAALDRSFGRHLPDAVYSQAITLGELADAVEKHLINHPKAQAHTREIPAAHHNVSLFPEYLELKRQERMLLAVSECNPYFRVDEGHDPQAPCAAGRSRIDGRELTNFCVYDYVGMAQDPTVIAATKAAIDRYGTGAGASRLVSGEKQIHGDLERSLAAFLGAPASLVFVSGHATNVTTIGHILGPGDLIVHDVLAHNSILQGARLSGATCRGFAHNDWVALDALLAGVRHDFRRVLIALEGVYSMDGDYPDLARFVAVKKKHRAMLMVDEAHSLGTMGATGRGLGEHAGVDRADVDLWMGTLSKSLASCGGYVAGSVQLIEYLKYTAPGFVYSVGIPPSNAAAALAALTLLEREPQRVTRLRELSTLFLDLTRERGLDTGLASGSPVVPVIVGSSVKCLLLSHALFRRGINVQPILHPAIPEHATRLRFFVTTNHTEAQIRSTVDAVAEEIARL